MNRKVLLICYYFPPLGLGGVGRPLNLFKELPALGWDCDILTVKPVAYRAYEPELLQGLDISRIYRSGSRDPQRLLHLFGVRSVKSDTIRKAKPASQRFFPDTKIGWVKPAIRLGRTLCENHRYDVVISTSPPVSAHLIGQQLHRDFGTPWIADFRDYWSLFTIEDTFDNPRQIARGRELMDRIQAEASAISAINDSIAAYVGAKHVIPNGYIAEYAEHWRMPPDDTRFTIGLLGHLHHKDEPDSLLQVLSQLKERDHDRYATIRILHVGLVDTQWFREVFARRGLNVEVVPMGPQSREEAVRKLSKAHVLYLNIGPHDSLMPARSPELIASGRPMLVYAPPDCDLCRILACWPYAHCFQQDGLTGAVDWLARQYEAFDTGTFVYEPLSEFAAQFSSRRLAERFADLMNGLV
jgi:glycosyltransferase involved in cell wall biosynthesis